jgi:hypothetical protein
MCLPTETGLPLRSQRRCYATARALAYETRINDCYFYPNSARLTPFPGGSYKFEDNGGAVNLNAKAMFFFYATGVTPAMTEKMVGEGSQYAGAFVEGQGQPARWQQDI